jgi:phage-related protein
LTSDDKPLVWLRGEVRSPPFTAAARVEAGVLLRQLQRGARLGMPHVRPVPRIGARCHELRIPDAAVTWRLIFRLDEDAIVILDVFAKKTPRIPEQVIERCRDRLRRYDAIDGEQ